MLSQSEQGENNECVTPPEHGRPSGARRKQDATTSRQCSEGHSGGWGGTISSSSAVILFITFGPVFNGEHSEGIV